MVLLIGLAKTDASVPLFWASLSLLLAFLLLLSNSGRIPRLMIPRVGPRPNRSDEPPPPSSCWRPSFEVSDRRRLHRRSGNPIPLLLVGLDGNRRLSGRVLDRSCGGLRLEAPRAAPEGTVLLVQACPSPPGSLWVPVTVRWSQAGRWRCEMGCQFVDALPPEALAPFG